MSMCRCIGKFKCGDTSVNRQLSQYVSNLDKDIYTVSNLPEEVIATVFAFVSRSPKSFRENLLKVTEEKASQFHEKWVLNYGHASVAELATVHLGIEKVSRLFSALFERCNLYLSPIEYSQRYQKPNRGDYYLPTELNDPIYIALKRDYLNFQEAQYNDYNLLFKQLLSYHTESNSPTETESEKSFISRIEKYAFEDARYLLTLATYTNLGLTSNARAMEDALINLLSSEYTELQQRGSEMKAEIITSLPTLVKYAHANRFMKKTKEYFQQFNEEKIADKYDQPAVSVKLLSYTGQGEKHPEEIALNTILTALYFQHQHHEDTNTNQLNTMRNKHFQEKVDIYLNLFSQMERHDNPPDALKLIEYQLELIISESCWHQLLRHRQVYFAWQYPTIQLGYIIPPGIKKGGAEKIYHRGMDRSQVMYDKLKETIGELTAHYVVTNGHYRKVFARFSLWELYHLINLRMSPHAQWEIRNLIENVAYAIQIHHPNLVQPAVDRLSKFKQ